MTSPSPFLVSRRSETEQRVLHLVRGGGAVFPLPVAERRPGTPRRVRQAMTMEQMDAVHRLARVAMEHGFAIQRPSALYIHRGELNLLRLVASAQAGTPPDQTHLAAALVEEIARCAAALVEAGVRLPITTASD